MTASNEMIGRIGAARLEDWAAQESVTANRSIHDDKAWDYLLQLSHSSHVFPGPLDQQSPQLSCMVQVKTTTGTDSSVSIKLSNWQKMCTDPVPWFVLAVQIDAETKRTIAAHLIHVDRDWCEKVFKRLRELSVENEPALHKKWLSVNWNEGSKLVEPVSTDLVAHLRLAVYPNQQEYVQEKLDWAKSVGYEDRDWRLSLKLSASNTDEIYQSLAQIAVRERTTFPKGWTARHSDVRFGIRARSAEYGDEHGEMEFRAPNQGRAKLEVEGNNGDRAEFDCEIFRARAVFPFLPSEFDKVRLASEDVVATIPTGMKPTRPVANVSFSIPNVPVPAMRLRNVVHLANLCLEAVRLAPKLVVTVKDVSLPLGVGTLISPDPEASQYVSTLLAGLRVIDAFALSDDLLVWAPALSKQSEAVHFIDSVLLDTENGGEAVAPFDRKVEIGEMFGMWQLVRIELETVTLVLLVGCYGKVSATHEVQPEKWMIKADSANLLHQRLTLTEDSDETRLVSEAQAELEAQLRKQGCTHVLDPPLHSRLISSVDEEDDEPAR